MGRGQSCLWSDDRQHGLHQTLQDQFVIPAINQKGTETSFPWRYLWFNVENNKRNNSSNIFKKEKMFELNLSCCTCAGQPMQWIWGRKRLVCSSPMLMCLLKNRRAGSTENMEMWGFLFLTISSGLRCAVRTKMEKTCSTTTGNGLEKPWNVTI